MKKNPILNSSQEPTLENGRFSSQPMACGRDSSRQTFTREEIFKTARDVLKTEAEGILHLMERMDDSICVAVQWILDTSGRVIVTGIGKSGIVGRKIVATLSSTGTPSFFLHPAEAMHGDLGMVRSDDIVLALSNSGETDELNMILPSLKRTGTRIIAFTGNPASTLARHCDLAIYTGVQREACPFGLAPTASSTAQLAMGDALAVALIKMRNFQPQDFRRFHPGGHLGERLRVPLFEVMKQGDAIPKVEENTLIPEALKEMSRKGVGATLVVNSQGQLTGIYTDGDLRRTLNQEAGWSSKFIVEVMTANPMCIVSEKSVADALEMMEQNLITVLPVVSACGELEGILHLHDLLGKGRIKFTA